MESLLACRWVLLLYAVLSFAMTALVTWFGKGLADRFFVRFPWQGMALAVVAALWLCLFWNNLLSLRSFLGFDSWPTWTTSITFRNMGAPPGRRRVRDVPPATVLPGVGSGAEVLRPVGLGRGGRRGCCSSCRSFWERRRSR